MRKLLFFFVIFCLNTIPNYSQNRNITFESLSVEQGLSHHFTMTVMQDRKGFLWFGTGNGLDKYDGYRFTHYKVNPCDTTSLIEYQVFTLCKDKDGTIWVGTNEDSCRFDPRNEKFNGLERSETNPTHPT